MKKYSFLFVCLGLIFCVSGCGNPGKLIHPASPQQEADQPEDTSANPRVYMDEMTGILMDFDGTLLTLQDSKGEACIFNVSQATLECEGGMISGDEVTVIYEGQLSDTDTSQTKALKVVDEFHKKAQLEERVAHVKVTGLTPNTISVESKKKTTAVYPITGTEQYYQNGIQAGSWVYIHFKGKFPPTGQAVSNALNATHIKVLSVSDTEPLTLPDPTPTPLPEDPAAENEKHFAAAIQNINGNILQVLPDGASQSINIDLSAIPCYFKGGTAPGSYVSVTYAGEFNGSTLDGTQILAVTGYDPETLKSKNITYTITGSVIGTTANTVTLKTTDGRTAICRTDNAVNAASGGLAVGTNVKVTFDPVQSKTSNIYQCLKIEDA